MYGVVRKFGDVDIDLIEGIDGWVVGGFSCGFFKFWVEFKRSGWFYYGLGMVYVMVYFVDVEFWIVIWVFFSV